MTIDQDRHAVIGIHLEEVCGELVPAPDITGDNLVLSAQLLQQYCHFLPVGCGPVVNFVHRTAFPSMPGSPSNRLAAPPCHRRGSRKVPASDTGLQEMLVLR